MAAGHEITPAACSDATRARNNSNTAILPQCWSSIPAPQRSHYAQLEREVIGLLELTITSTEIDTKLAFLRGMIHKAGQAERYLEVTLGVTQ